MAKYLMISAVTVVSLSCGAMLAAEASETSAPEKIMKALFDKRQPLQHNSSGHRRDCQGFDDSTIVSRIIMDDPNAGFATLLVGTINGILESIRTNSVPYPDWGFVPDSVRVDPKATANDGGRVSKDGIPIGWRRFYVESLGPNPWLYYFDPLTTWHPGCPGRIVDVYPFRELHWRIDSIQSYYYGWYALKYLKSQRYSAYFYDRNRLKGAQIVSQYIKPQGKIHEIADNLIDRFNPDGYPLLGVQVRASDIQTSQINRTVSRRIGLKPFLPYMQRWLAQFDGKARIFFASDVPKIEQAAKKLFGDKLFLYEGALQSTDPYLPAVFLDDTAFGDDPMVPYRKGLDPLIISMALSKCDALITQESSIAEVAFYMNPSLMHTSVHVQYTLNRVEPLWAQGALDEFCPECMTEQMQLDGTLPSNSEFPEMPPLPEQLQGDFGVDETNEETNNEDSDRERLNIVQKIKRRHRGKKRLA
eukprot:m.563777 g.563777  ORF g.563777 m.563777 type:complete len:474 (+) comp22235_c4_seq4:270-1691(+)